MQHDELESTQTRNTIHWQSFPRKKWCKARSHEFASVTLETQQGRGGEDFGSISWTRQLSHGAPAKLEGVSVTSAHHPKSAIFKIPQWQLSSTSPLAFSSPRWQTLLPEAALSMESSAADCQ
eukprot:381770-Amphidinium_carterae.1